MRGIKFCGFGRNPQTLYLLKFLPHIVVVKCQPCLCYATFLEHQACLLQGLYLFTAALHEANKRATSLSREPHEAGPGPKCAKNTYSSYSAEDRARIGRHAAEHGKKKASWHFTVPEFTAHLLEKQYLAELHDQRQNSVVIPEITSLPTKALGHPFLLGSTLDCQVKSML